jgi:hypothetical protein
VPEARVAAMPSMVELALKQQTQFSPCIGGHLTEPKEQKTQPMKELVKFKNASGINPRICIRDFCVARFGA